MHPLRDSGGRHVRNSSWFHMINDDVISMPDKWEYPWYASWDLAFHTVALAMVDIDEAKHQLALMLRELYLHPSGQLPAYEWNFSDVNPPVHAWATLLVYETELEQRGNGRRRVAEGRVPEAPRELHLVDQPQGPRPVATSSRAASSASTTSASSTGAHRSRPAATSSSPTAPRGWPSSRSPCSASPSSSPITRTMYERHGAQVRRALHVHRRRDGPHRRQPRRAVGRGGRLLLRRPPTPRRHARNG